MKEKGMIGGKKLRKYQKYLMNCDTHLTCSLFLYAGMTIPDEDSEAGQTGKYCLVAIGRLQVCISDVS